MKAVWKRNQMKLLKNFRKRPIFPSKEKTLTKIFWMLNGALPRIKLEIIISRMPIQILKSQAIGCMIWHSPINSGRIGIQNKIAQLNKKNLLTSRAYGRKQRWRRFNLMIPLFKNSLILFMDNSSIINNTKLTVSMSNHIRMLLKNQCNRKKFR